jgi:hypothetical protein
LWHIALIGREECQPRRTPMLWFLGALACPEHNRCTRFTLTDVNSAFEFDEADDDPVLDTPDYGPPFVVEHRRAGRLVQRAVITADVDTLDFLRQFQRALMVGLDVPEA